MMNKHTPGPWQATENAYGCQFVQRWEAGEAHDLICGGNSHDTLTKGNARLIAAAPELLAQLKHAVHWHDQLTPADIARYEAEIAKAEGCALPLNAEGGDK